MFTNSPAALWGHQLVGDSMLTRLAVQTSGLPRRAIESPTLVPGCRARRLISCLRNLRHMEPRVVLMIGTNDLRLARTMDDAYQLIADLEVVLALLLGRGCGAVVMTLPPVARAARSSSHWRILNAVNAWILGLTMGTMSLFTTVCGRE
ncbi:uncharacterized protein LOC144137659 [Haemaphysalis longicornis]